MYLRPHVAFFCIIFHVSALDDSYKRRSSYREHILSIILYLLIIILTYYLWFWIKHGQTLGMKSWKTYVLNTDNTKINIRQGIIRIILALVGGHLVLIFTSKSLQDIISNSHIVKLKS